MQTSKFFKALLITSCTFITTIKFANAEQDIQNTIEQGIISVKQKLSEVNTDTIEQKKLDGDNDSVLDKHDQCPNSPKGNKVDQYGCTIYTKMEPIKEGTVTISLLVNFENDQYIVQEEYFPKIERVANFLKKYPNTSLVIEGHTSSQGASKYNKDLSQKRADEVVKILVNKFFINSDRLSAVGYGEELLLDLTDTFNAHTVNRRIEGKFQ
jgi:OOP family OmpA-OmpF porin